MPYRRKMRRRLLRGAVEKAGITRLRLEVRSGVEGPAGGFDKFVRDGSSKAWRQRRYVVSNDNADPRIINWAGFDFSEMDRDVEMAVLPMRKLLAARGEKLFVNLCYVGFVEGRPNLHENPEEYAEFALATMLHLREKYGLEPDSWEVILEPDLAGRWSGQRIGRTILATSRRFAENGIRVGFVAPSTTSMANASRYFDDMLKVDGALPHLAELSYHRYSGVNGRALANLTERSARYHVPIAMTELWFGRAGPDVLFEDLGAGAVAFQNRVVGGAVRRRPQGQPDPEKGCALQWRVISRSPPRGDPRRHVVEPGRNQGFGFQACPGRDRHGLVGDRCDERDCSRTSGRQLCRQHGFGIRRNPSCPGGARGQWRLAGGDRRAIRRDRRAG